MLALFSPVRSLEIAFSVLPLLIVSKRIKNHILNRQRTALAQMLTPDRTRAKAYFSRVKRWSAMPPKPSPTHFQETRVSDPTRIIRGKEFDDFAEK